MMKQHVFHVRRHIFVKISLFTTVLLLTLLALSRPVLAVPKIYWINPTFRTMRIEPDGSNLELLRVGGGFDIALDPGAGKVYTAGSGVNGIIYRMNPDGSDSETLINLGLLTSFMYDIALDLRAGKIYWVYGRSHIGRANLDGSEIEDLVSLPEGGEIYGLALDTEGGKMYWANQETDTIRRANLDGTEIEDVLTDLHTPYDLALDINADKMYWTARDDRTGYVYRANLNGSDLEVLVGVSDMEPGAIALEPGNDKIIWVDERYETDSYGRVVHGGGLHQADLDGDNREILVDQFIGNDLVGGIPTGLAAADMPVQSVEQLYWIEREFPGGDRIDRFWRGNLNGDNREMLMRTDYRHPTGALAVDIVNGKMYYGCESPSGIRRANLDGSDVEDLISTEGFPKEIALDTTAGKIYWTLHSRIQRANLDGTEIEDVLTDLSQPRDLALDLLTGKIFWVDHGGDIWRANLDGTDAFWSRISGWLVKRIAVDAQAGNMYVIAEPDDGEPDSFDSVYTMMRYHYRGIGVATELFELDLSLDLSREYIEDADVALDLSNSKIYWIEPSINEIQRANLDGTNRETFRNVRNPMGLALGANVPVQGFPKMYWTDTGNATVQRADLNGTDVKQLVSTGLTEPTDIALSRSVGKIYWTDSGTGKIQRAELNGLNVEDMISIDGSRPQGLALDDLAGKIYWTETFTHTIRRANLDGTGWETLIEGTFPQDIALDLDAGKMYWTDEIGKIRRANLDGTDVEDVVINLLTPRGIALDSDAGKVYWADYNLGKIQRANLDGSEVEDLITDLGMDLAYIALDPPGGKMYWTSNNAWIERANLDGSARETVVSDGNRIQGIALHVLLPVIPMMQAPPTSAVRNAVDRIGGTALIDVNPGDVFSYLITATNLFDHAVFLTIHDALDEYLDYVAGTFTVNGATASDEFFTDDILEYQHPDLIQPGYTLELGFDVIVQDFAPHDWLIGNEVVITATLDPQNLSGYAVTLETNRSEVRVENPIPEPSTGLFLATGLLVLLALGRRRRNTSK